MESNSDYFLGQDGSRIHYRLWDAEKASKVLCLVHGLGEHIGRYEEFAAFLNEQGVAVFGMDLRGHGRSDGKRGHAKSYPLLMSDIEELLKTARAVYTELPMILMGHSMGGNLVGNYMIRMNTNELAGFILSAPWFGLAFEPPKWKLSLAETIARLLPGLRQSSDLNTHALSRDPKAVEAYENDPLVHKQLSAGLFMKIREACSFALLNAHQIDSPGLVFHGDGDQIIDWKSTHQFAEQCQNVTWKKLAGVYHEPLNDINKQDTMEMINSFIEQLG